MGGISIRAIGDFLFQVARTLLGRRRYLLGVPPFRNSRSVPLMPTLGNSRLEDPME